MTGLGQTEGVGLVEAVPAGAALDTPAFTQAVYALVRAVPCGKVTTYGWLARRLNRPLHARLVGYALHGAQDRDGVPCHRVVNSQGRLSGAPHFGPPGQKALLEEEGVVFRPDGAVDLASSLWRPDDSGRADPSVKPPAGSTDVPSSRRRRRVGTAVLGHMDDEDREGGAARGPDTAPTVARC